MENKGVVSFSPVPFFSFFPFSDSKKRQFGGPNSENLGKKYLYLETIDKKQCFKNLVQI